MNILYKVLIALSVALLSTVSTSAQNNSDVFAPISKYIAQGNSDALYAWFSDSVEVTILSRVTDASRSQARQILKAFFNSYTPRSFEVTHTAGRAGMKYAYGNLNAGGENFRVTIFVSCSTGNYLIQQFKIDRIR